MNNAEFQDQYDAKAVKLDINTPCNKANKYRIYALLDTTVCGLEICEKCAGEAIAGDMVTLYQFAKDPQSLQVLLTYVMAKLKDDKAKAAH